MQDPIREWTELEFRDGKRMVADYLVVMMKDIKTHTMTYDQAIEAANKKVESDLLNAKQKDHASKHLHDLHDKLKTFLGTAGS